MSELNNAIIRQFSEIVETGSPDDLAKLRGLAKTSPRDLAVMMVSNTQFVEGRAMLGVPLVSAAARELYRMAKELEKLKEKVERMEAPGWSRPEPTALKWTGHSTLVSADWLNWYQDKHGLDLQKATLEALQRYIQGEHPYTKLELATHRLTVDPLENNRIILVPLGDEPFVRKDGVLQALISHSWAINHMAHGLRDMGISLQIGADTVIAELLKDDPDARDFGFVAHPRHHCGVADHNVDFVIQRAWYEGAPWPPHFYLTEEEAAAKAAVESKVGNETYMG